MFTLHVHPISDSDKSLAVGGKDPAKVRNVRIQRTTSQTLHTTKNYSTRSTLFKHLAPAFRLQIAFHFALPRTYGPRIFLSLARMQALPRTDESASHIICLLLPPPHELICTRTLGLLRQFGVLKKRLDLLSSIGRTRSPLVDREDSISSRRLGGDQCRPETRDSIFSRRLGGDHWDSISSRRLGGDHRDSISSRRLGGDQSLLPKHGSFV